MKKTIKLERRFMIFKAHRKINADMYHYYSINGKRTTYGEYMKKRMMCIYDCKRYPYKSYTQVMGNGTLVDVDIL